MAGRNFNINIVQSQFVDDLLERIHQKKNKCTYTYI